MARTGRPKGSTLEDQINNCKARIEKLNERLREEKKRLVDLQARKKSKDQQAVLNAFEASGKSIDEIYEMLNK